MSSATHSESATPLCAVEGCGREKIKARGWCQMHYQRWWATGDPGPAESLKPSHVTAHGTYNEYGNYGCRCDECKAAAIEWQRRVQESPCETCGKPTWGRFRGGRWCRKCAALARSVPIEERHGTEVGYSKGCRCPDCRSAAAKARRDRRHTNLEATRAYDRARYYGRAVA